MFVCVCLFLCEYVCSVCVTVPQQSLDEAVHEMLVYLLCRLRMY
jgi:hypothetical protein